MTDRTPILVKRKKHWPFMWVTLEIPEIDSLDTVTIYGLDPNETMYCKAVNAETLADVAVTVTNNVAQVTAVGIDDRRLIVFAYGKMTP